MGLFDKGKKKESPMELVIDMRITEQQIPNEIKALFANEMWFALYPERVSKFVVDIFTQNIWNPENRPFHMKLSNEVKAALTEGKDPLSLIYKPKSWRRINVSWFHEDCGASLTKVMDYAGFDQYARGIFPALLIPDFLGEDIPGYTVEIWPVFYPKPEPWNNMDYFRYGTLPHPALAEIGGYETGIRNMLQAFNQGMFVPARIVWENSIIRYYAPADIVEKCGWGLEASAEKNILGFEELTPSKFS